MSHSDKPKDTDNPDLIEFVVNEAVIFIYL